ncbi:dual specificity protein phosphatase 3-like isoform X5 [Branchiostoma floridae x Branchiostoma belcheri]
MLKVLWVLESLFAVLGLLLFARLVIIATQLLNRPTSVLPRAGCMIMTLCLPEDLPQPARSIAQDVAKLKSLGVTHVLNAAHGAIDVSKEYEKVGIEYLGVPADDVPTYNLKQHFEPAAAFINTAVKKGKVLVHCHVGYSRSPTLVAAYLMLYQELTAQESITLIRGKRFIGPNDGFLRQLCEFNDQLVEEGRLELP